MSVKGLKYKLVFILTFFFVQAFAWLPDNYVLSADTTGIPGTQTLSADSLEEKLRQKVYDTFKYLEENNRFVESLDLTTVVDFPIGIKKTIGNLEYIIAIDSIVITPTYAFLNASMLFQPSGKDRIAFRGTDIKFTSQGGLTGDARLELIGDHTLHLPGGKTSLIIKGDGTYVEWDCDGFKQFNLLASLSFSRDILLPLDPNENIAEGEVEAEFSINLRDWNDLVATVNMQPFQVTGLNGFSFYIEDAVFDFSDFRNPTGITFPGDYQSSFLLEGNETLWRGVFIRSVVVNLPSQFESEDGERPYIEGVNLIIDRMGLTGELSGKHILSLDAGSSGSMQGWPFSIETIKVNLSSGRLTEASIEGEIILPVADQNSSLQYHAIIDHQNNYFFNIAPTDSLNFALWQAGEVALYPSSYLNVEVVNGKFTPSAKLNGRMTIDAPISNLQKATIADILFEDLSLGADAPYVYGGVFSTGSDQELPRMSGFNMDIEKIGIRTLSDNTLSLDIDAGIILSGSSGGSFAASGGFSILSEDRPINGRTKLVYKNTEVKKIELKVNNNAFTFTGQLVFYRDNPVFGEGFMGSIDAIFKPDISLKATARFGTVNDMKYWYVDALATFNTPITISPGFGIYGFGGGAYHHMKIKLGGKSQAGTLSGSNYIPDAESGLGLRAAVAFGAVPTEGAYKGDASFEILFYKTGGIRNINFKGEVKFMTPPASGKLEQLISTMETIGKSDSNAEQPEDALQNKNKEDKSSGNGSVEGHVSINYDFSNSILHGNIAVFVNAAGGALKGAGSRNKAGWAVLHFAPQEWYVHIGTPANKLGLIMGVGDISARADGYLMVGTNIPASPPPNENVGRILGGINLDYMRDENALGLGSGFALGAALSFNTGNLTFWKFYARFMAGTGFDIMLKNYGPEVSCANRSGPIGLNGWYANGQAYAFFDGKIGVRVRVFGKKQDIDIISLAAAAVLQAKMPNPVWMRGVVGGYFNILGGLVKGQCKFEVIIGEECDLQGGSAVSGIKVIADITPATGEKEVSVFNNPQAVFNMPINQVFKLVDIDNKQKAFKIKLDYFRVKNSKTTINGTLEWNSGLDVAILNSHEILPPTSEIKVEVQISFAKKEGGQWVPVTTNGNIVVERLATTFTTGVAPDYIPLANVKYSYPVVEMVNFYPAEHDKGYIQLKKGQAYLFKSDKKWKKVGKMISASGTKTFTFNYNISKKRIDFDLPGLATNKVYDFQLVSVPLTDVLAIDRNVTKSSKTVASGTGSKVKISSKKADGAIDELKENRLFSTKFRSSKFKNFNDKIEALTFGRTFRVMVKAWDLHLLKSPMLMSEFFDFTELSGNKFTGNQPLIAMEALLDNDYYQKLIYPLIYANYPIDKVAKIKNRDIEKVGLPPVKAISIDYANQLSQPDFASALSAINTGKSYLIYDLPRYYREDYFDIRGQVIPLYLNQPGPIPQQVNALMFKNFPYIDDGKYKVKLNYYLPGEKSPHSSYVVETNLKLNYYIKK